jgi:hypothetical protein
MKEREREECADAKGRKKGYLLFIYNFATYAHLTNAHFPTPTRASLRGQMQTALATVARLFRSLLPPGNRITYHEFVVQVF